ncbi:RNI-like protein [Neolentinus lepideus HHB14362 ss-1]|uniref:RNI-like protein n=1 Tax=Neolentinus lepideus HHB14362 ss-1 TaxID=1314782 RepID=A0A165STS8_9AGAM|nr:RNI-like protein [Neolentinus lepideus HHB14362 ss-1]
MSTWTTTIDTRSRTNVTFKPAAAVSLANRSTIDCANKRLSSTEGVKDIIRAISSRRIVTKLFLGHNFLEDEGCIALFDFLRSPNGQKYKIQEINLKSNSIDDRGLVAIANYLRENQDLKILLLQNNAFHGNPETVTTFTEAVNSSCLDTLSLATNTHLSDPFASQFLSALDAHKLRELHLSMMNITDLSVDPIIHFLISHRCRLRTLKLSGNNLGAHSVTRILRAVTVYNYNITRLEMSANFNLVPDDALGEDELSSLAEWPQREKELKRVMDRNEFLARMRQKEALFLLACSRRLLLRSRRGDSVPPIAQPNPKSFPFRNLPTELQLHILSLTAPRLSNAQHLRIFAYAADPDTLPPSPNGAVGQYTCIPDPGGLPFNTGLGTCASGTCLGAGNSLQCRKEKLRNAWLDKVDCVLHEPD